MLQSMTGFGKATGEYKGKNIVVEVKSLNSKQADISTRITGLYREKDIEIRNDIAQKLYRGKIDFALYFENAGKETTTQINQASFESYTNQIKQIASNINLELPHNWFEIVLRMPDVLKSEVVELEEEEWIYVKGIISNALDELINYRQAEGAVLKEVLKNNINTIHNLLQEVAPYETERVEKIRAKLEENLQSLSEKFDFDQNRLEQELIYYIEKLDVNEEKVRLQTHLDYFLETLENEATPGKKLGFIAQEIGREINTLGSKSNHSEMQKIVVLMKDELEQVKEQMLNIL